MKEVLTISQMQNAEKELFDSGVSEFELMEKAVCGIFEHVKKKVKTLIVVGSGNNGGDGLGLAVKLAENKTKVEVWLVSDKQKECSLRYLNILKTKNVKIYKKNDFVDLSCYDQIVDCIFGIGFHGEMPLDIKEIVERINDSGKFILSVDVPSGVNGKGEKTDFAVKSNLTVCVGCLKIGNVYGDIKDFCEKTAVCDIGIDKTTNTFLLEETDLKKIFVKRKNNCHKGDFGYVAVMGGSIEYSGALKLANLSTCALRCGAGVSSLIAPSEIAHSVLPYLSVSTLYSFPSKNGKFVFDEEQINLALKKINTLAIGMGMGNGEENKKIIEYILDNYSINLIIDADGLNALAKIDKLALKNTKCKVVLTPHILEFSRISGFSREEILKNPIDLAKKFAKEYNVILLLKGATTIITDGEITHLVNRGAPGMATAGSGDVLSGAICGVLGWADFSLLAVSSACYVCGVAGELASKEFGDISMTALDSCSFIPKVIKLLN